MFKPSHAPHALSARDILICKMSLVFCAVALLTSQHASNHYLQNAGCMRLSLTVYFLPPGGVLIFHGRFSIASHFCCIFFLVFLHAWQSSKTLPISSSPHRCWHLHTPDLCIAMTRLSPLQHLVVAKDLDSDSLRRYSWTPDALDNVNLVSSPVHSG